MTYLRIAGSAEALVRVSTPWGMTTPTRPLSSRMVDSMCWIHAQSPFPGGGTTPPRARLYLSFAQVLEGQLSSENGGLAS